MKVMVGSGKGPPVDETALRKFVFSKISMILNGLICIPSLLGNTAVDQYEATKGDDGSE